MTDELRHLASLIRKKNEVDGAIAQLIERPALAGNRSSSAPTDARNRAKAFPRERGNG